MESEAQLLLPDRQQKAVASPTVRSWEENACGLISQRFFPLGSWPASSLYSNLQQLEKHLFFSYLIFFT